MQRLATSPPKPCQQNRAQAISRQHLAGLLAVAGALLAGEVQAQVNYRDDDVAMVLVFSLRETAQMHLLANALAKASLKGVPAEDIAPQCDRAIAGFERISMPMLRKYLGNVEHDPETRETFDGILDVQQAVLVEMRAVRAMAGSGNDAEAVRAVVTASEKYDETVKPVLSAIFRAKEPRQPEQAAGPPDAGRSPDSRVLSNDEWAGVVAVLHKQGMVRSAEDARAYFGTFALLKGVFVEKGITEPSTTQLFGLAKTLSVALGQVPPEKIETTLRTMLQLAKETATEVASRDALMRLGD